MVETIKKMIHATSWPLRAAMAMVLLVIFVGGPIFLARFITFGSDKEFSLYLFLCVVLIVVISSLVGGIAALLSTEKQIGKIENKLGDALGQFDKLLAKAHSALCDITSESDKLSKISEFMEKEIGRAKEIVQIALEKFGQSIIDYRALQDIESSVAENGEIWILTSALELEADELKETIRQNLQNKVRYTYLIPDEPALKEKMRRLANEWKGYCGSTPATQIRCLLVPKHFAYMTVIIYNPYDKTPVVLVKFPKSDIYAMDKYPFIYRVDSKPHEAWETFRDSLQALIDDKRACRLVKPLKLDLS